MRILALVCFAFVGASAAVGQQAPVPTAPIVRRDTNAIAIAQNVLSALTGGGQLSAITLNGNVTLAAGSSSESGSVSLSASGTSESKVSLNLPTGNRTEMRTSSGGTPSGQWIDETGQTNVMASHNCLTDAAWFSPALGSLAQISNPNLTVAYIDQEIRNGDSVFHLRTALNSPDQYSGTVDQLFALSAEDYYIDVKTYLPVAVVFETHADNDVRLSFEVEIDFGDYQVNGGFEIPLHIQKYLNGSLLLDMSIEPTSVNTASTVGVQ